MSKINHKFPHVDGSFDTDSGKLICVVKKKYGSVDLCFKESMYIPFAKIRLHSRDRYVDAMAVMDDAQKLGDEIANRWNDRGITLERLAACARVFKSLSCTSTCLDDVVLFDRVQRMSSHIEAFLKDRGKKL